ncbi:MAG: hypothetical protein HC923_05780, partial [Myxococcales bacterium]|nr:hypothetical protein [Myxococcales bacterium]
VTAGIALAVFGLDQQMSLPAASVVVILVCASLLAAGGFRGFERVTMVLVVVFTVSTLIATAVAGIEWPGSRAIGEVAFRPADLAFMAALIGWMPSAIDVSVWQSLWTLERGRRGASSRSSILIDFHVGYFGTAILALCFVVLGASLMHGRGLSFESGAAAFSRQLIDLYAATLGDWSRPLIGACALAVMLSTTLTVLDGFPRALVRFAAVLSNRDFASSSNGNGPTGAGSPSYRAAPWGSSRGSRGRSRAWSTLQLRFRFSPRRSSRR